MILKGKRIVVTGVMTKDSIGYHVAEQAQQAGAEIVLTSFGRIKRMTDRAAKRLPDPPPVLELDVTSSTDFERLAGELRDHWGHVDGVLHAVAHGPPDAFAGNFLFTSPEDAKSTFETSAYSLAALTRGLRPLFDSDRGAAIVGLNFDGTHAWPTYDWMGVSKAALEAVCRYLACYLGPEGVRVNLVNSGPLFTPSASSIAGFENFSEKWLEAPLGWDRSDPAPVARAACFLLSDWASAITGETLNVDGGFRAMGISFAGMHDAMLMHEAALEPPDDEP